MSSSAISKPPEDLIKAAEQGDAEAQTDLGRWYAENLPETPDAWAWFRRAADQGSPRAMHNLGVTAFRSGDHELAIEWLRKAVAADWVNSLFPLGRLLEEQGDYKGAIDTYTKGVNRDCADSMDAMARLVLDKEIRNLYPYAHDWCARAIEKGHVGAHMQLAQIYHEGLGVERDPKKAASLWITAAQHGHPGAQFALGVACDAAVGLKKDPIASMRFLRASAAQGNEGAAIYMRPVERRLTPEERAEFETNPELPSTSSPSPAVPPPFLLWAAEAGDAKSQNDLGSWYSKNVPGSPLVLTWFRRAADQGDPRGYHNLGVEAYKADDMKTAVEWLRKSTAKGLRGSFKVLGIIMEGSGDIVAATQLFERGAEKNCPVCQSRLGRLAFDEGTPSSYQRARHWDEKAAAQGDVEAQTRLGIMLDGGLGGTRDPEQAVNWWLQAAQQGDREAQYLTGVALHKGASVDKDRLAAMRLLRASAAQGSPRAKSYLPQVEAELTPEEKSQLAGEAAAKST